MFYFDSNLINLKIQNFNTENVQDMSYMFGGTALKTLDLSFLKANNIKDMSYMFHNCGPIIKFKYINTQKVINMAKMFYICNKLQSLDISNFDTTLVTYMSYMLANLNFFRNK